MTRLEAPLFLWWSRTGADQGRPWLVKPGDAEPTRFARVVLVGSVETLAHESGSFPWPDGPRGCIVLREGYAEVE